MTVETASRTPSGHLRIHVIAFLSGGLLSVMLLANGTLAAQTSAAFASWGAHATGAVVALAVLLLTGLRRRQVWTGRAPLWAFSGGVAGALIVTATVTAANSALSLAGTLALGLAGQALFGLVADRLGLFGLPVRRIGWQDIAALALVVAGSVALILSVAQPA